MKQSVEQKRGDLFEKAKGKIKRSSHVEQTQKEIQATYLRTGVKIYMKGESGKVAELRMIFIRLRLCSSAEGREKVSFNRADTMNVT